MYYRARFYDTELGRFLQKDPLTGGPDDPSICYKTNIYSFFDRVITENINSLDPHNTNRYAYCRNNPINFTDPLGLEIITGLAVYLTALTTSPDFSTDCQMLSQSLAEGDYIGATGDLVGLAIPAVPSAVTRPVAKGSAKLGKKALSGIAEGFSKLAKKFATKFGDDVTKAVTRNIDEATGGIAKGKKLFNKAGKGVAKTEIVERAMSKAELKAIQKSGKLSKGGRPGSHYVSDAVNSNANRARQRLSLPQTPEVRVKMEVPKDVFKKPTKVKPGFNMPGGGMERTAPGNIDIPVKIRKRKKM